MKKLRSNIINFFYKHRVVDSHIGVLKVNIWLYVLATYLNLHLIGINISFNGWPIFRFYVDLCKPPYNLIFKFMLFGFGIDTNRKRAKEAHIAVGEYFAKKEEALKNFKKSLNSEQSNLITEYENLR